MRKNRFHFCPTQERKKWNFSRAIKRRNGEFRVAVFIVSLSLFICIRFVVFCWWFIRVFGIIEFCKINCDSKWHKRYDHFFYVQQFGSNITTILFNRQKVIWIQISNIFSNFYSIRCFYSFSGTSCYLKNLVVLFRKLIWWQKLSGEQLAYNNPEDGFITWFTHQNHTSCSFDDRSRKILKICCSLSKSTIFIVIFSLLKFHSYFFYFLKEREPTIMWNTFVFESLCITHSFIQI